MEAIFYQIKELKIQKIKKIKELWLVFGSNQSSILCRPSEYFIQRGKYYVGRYGIPSLSVMYFVGRCSTPFRSIAYSVGRHDICANCGSTLSAVGVFPQL